MHQDLVEKEICSAPRVPHRLSARAAVRIVQQRNLSAFTVGRQEELSVQDGAVFRLEIACSGKREQLGRQIQLCRRRLAAGQVQLLTSRFEGFGLLFDFCESDFSGWGVGKFRHLGIRFPWLLFDISEPNRRPSGTRDRFSAYQRLRAGLFKFPPAFAGQVVFRTVSTALVQSLYEHCSVFILIAAPKWELRCSCLADVLLSENPHPVKRSLQFALVLL